MDGQLRKLFKFHEYCDLLGTMQVTPALILEDIRTTRFNFPLLFYKQNLS